MGHDWILDVLADLKSFAQANDLPSLATHLDDAALVARAEIASHAEGTGFGKTCGYALAGRSVGAVGRG